MVHRSSQPNLVYFLSSITLQRSALLGGQEHVQVDLDAVDAVAQLLADVGTHVVLVCPQSGRTGLVHQGGGLLAQAAAQSRKGRSFNTNICTTTTTATAAAAIPTVASMREAVQLMWTLLWDSRQVTNAHLATLTRAWNSGLARNSSTKSLAFGPLSADATALACSLLKAVSSLW